MQPLVHWKTSSNGNSEQTQHLYSFKSINFNFFMAFPKDSNPESLSSDLLRLLFLLEDDMLKPISPQKMTNNQFKVKKLENL